MYNSERKNLFWLFLFLGYPSSALHWFFTQKSLQTVLRGTCELSEVESGLAT